MVQTIVQLKKMKLEESIDTALVSNADDYLDFMNNIKTDKGLNNFFLGQMFHWYNSLLKGEGE